VSFARDMLEASPVATDLGIDAVAEAIEACLTCGQTCTSCANSDLAEPDVTELARCAALCITCADVCLTTMRVLSRPFGSDHRVTHHMLSACVLTCTASAEECHMHAPHHRHCAVCEKACRACLHACEALLQHEAFQQLQKLGGT
jgi:hypothetical protein